MSQIPQTTFDIQLHFAIEDMPIFGVYQRAILCHIHRRGFCWEGVRKLAERKNMSVGSARNARKWLLENGYVMEYETNGKRGLCVNRAKFQQPSDRVVAQPDHLVTQLYENSDHLVTQSDHVMTQSDHPVTQSDHVVTHKETIKKQIKKKEEESTPPPSPDEWQPEDRFPPSTPNEVKTIIMTFQNETGFPCPYYGTAEYDDKWSFPATNILRQGRRLNWQGDYGQLVRDAIKINQQGGYSFVTIKSIYKTAIGEMSKQQQKATKPQGEDPKRLWVKLKYYRQRMDGTERMKAEEPSLYQFVSQNVDFWRAMARTNADFIDQKRDEFCTRWDIYQESVNQLTDAVTV